jgi:hypothetical protein
MQTTNAPNSPEARVTPAPRASRSSRSRHLLEAGVIVIVATVLVTVGLANYRSSRVDSARLICLSNMRTIMHEAELYAGDNAIAEASLGADRLLGAGMVTERTTHCPLGGPHDAYIVTIRNGHPVSVVCPVCPREHVWRPESP